MKAIISDDYTDIFPTNNEVTELCRPGAGADTCIWLIMGARGWECCCKHRPWSLLDRWKKGETNAKRDGCDKVESFHPFGMELGEHTI